MTEEEYQLWLKEQQDAIKNRKKLRKERAPFNPDITDEETLTFLDRKPYSDENQISVLVKFEKEDDDGEKITKVYKLLSNGELLETEMKKLTSICQFNGEWYRKKGFHWLNYLKHDDLKIIFDAIWQELNNRIYLREDEEISFSLFSLFAISTYFQEIFDTYPYINITSSDKGAGKTNTAKSIMSFCHMGKVTKITRSAAMRIIEREHNTSFFDEINKYDEKDEIWGMLITSYKRGNVYSITNTNSGEVDDYEPFSPKIFAYTKDLPHLHANDLLSRSLIFKVYKNIGKNFVRIKQINENEPDENDKKFEFWRNLLYLYKLKFSPEVKNIHEETKNDYSISGRNRELFLNFLTLAKIVKKDHDGTDLYEKILNYAKEHQRKTEEVSKEWDNEYIVKILLANKLHDKSFILNEITTKLNEVAISLGEKRDGWKGFAGKTISKRLDVLGFEKDDEKYQGKTVIFCSKNQLDYQVDIYIVEDMTKEDLNPFKIEDLTIINKREKQKKLPLIENLEDNHLFDKIMKFLNKDESRSLDDLVTHCNGKRQEILGILKALFREGTIYEPEDKRYRLT